jgi:hypothetical protein
VIPLYAAQDTTASLSKNMPGAAGAGAGAGAGGSGSSVTGSGNTTSVVGELPAPQLLMRFPPLAYLLNCFLTHMNYLRECPLVSTQRPAYEVLVSVFRDLSVYLVQKAPEVRSVGEKYFGEGFLRDLGGYKAGAKKAAGGAGSVSQQKIDCLYGQAMALELFPHLLMCFDSIYNTNSARLETRMKALKSKESRRGASLSATAASVESAPTSSSSSSQLSCLVSNLFEVKDLLDAEAVDCLEDVWGVLVEGNLLDKQALSRECIIPAVTHLVPTAATAAATAATALTSTVPAAMSAGSDAPAAADHEEDGDSVARSVNGKKFDDDSNKDD